MGAAGLLHGAPLRPGVAVPGLGASRACNAGGRRCGCPMVLTAPAGPRNPSFRARRRSYRAVACIGSY